MALQFATALERKLASTLVAVLKEYRYFYDDHDGRFDAYSEPAAEKAITLLLTCGYRQSDISRSSD